MALAADLEIVLPSYPRWDLLFNHFTSTCFTYPLLKQRLGFAYGIQMETRALYSEFFLEAELHDL